MFEPDQGYYRPAEEEIRLELFKLVDKEGHNNFARRLGISPGFLSEVRRGRKRISTKLAAEVGYRLVYHWVKE